MGDACLFVLETDVRKLAVLRARGDRPREGERDGGDESVNSCRWCD